MRQGVDALQAIMNKGFVQQHSRSRQSVRAAMKLCFFCIAAMAALLAAGCNLPDPQPPLGESGTLRLTLVSGTLLPRTLEPPIDMGIVSFDIHGTGPDPFSDVFDVLGVKGSPLVMAELAPGPWTVTVGGRNAAGALVGNGQTVPPVLVSVGEVTDAEIVITPLSGTGVLDLVVQWTKGSHPSAVVECSLISMSTGADLAPSFSLVPAKDPMKATFRTSTIEAGYYLLLLRLYDGAVLYWGIAEAVRIVAGQTTSQTWDLN